jgi:two-component system chemotaxis response regulator CheY
VFLDIELPDGDGKELIAEINKINEKINVVMVSAHSTVDNVKDAIERGAKGFVVKPFSPKKIAAMLKKFYPELELY